MTTFELEDSLGLTFCERYSLSIESGSGVSVWDENGKHFLDFTSGWGVTSLGHSHPTITNAIIEQASKLLQCPNSGFVYSPVRASALQELHKVLPASLVSSYFVNSGAEANDAAIKLARKISGRSKIVSTLNSFHGRTLNTLSVSTNSKNAAKFLSAAQGIEFVEFGNIEAMAQAVDFHTAAVIVEPIQGEGGARVPGENYLSEISKLCKQNNAFLIVDEVQTGFCRTGKFFSFQQEEPYPQIDFLTMGKGMAGGFPIAAFSVSAAVKSQIEKGDHGGTYCGNPLGCAVVAAVVPFLNANRIDEKVTAKGRYVESALLELSRNYPDLIVEIRGRGLLWGIQLKSQSMVKRLTLMTLERGLLIVPTRNAVVRLIPSLVSSLEELKEGLDVLDGSLRCLRSAA